MSKMDYRMPIYHEHDFMVKTLCHPFAGIISLHFPSTSSTCEPLWEVQNSVEACRCRLSKDEALAWDKASWRFCIAKSWPKTSTSIQQQHRQGSRDEVDPWGTATLYPCQLRKSLPWFSNSLLSCYRLSTVAVNCVRPTIFRASAAWTLFKGFSRCLDWHRFGI